VCGAVDASERCEVVRGWTDGSTAGDVEEDYCIGSVFALVCLLVYIVDCCNFMAREFEKARCTQTSTFIQSRLLLRGCSNTSAIPLHTVSAIYHRPEEPPAPAQLSAAKPVSAELLSSGDVPHAASEATACSDTSALEVRGSG
jgi:hypothetical protein